MSESASTSNKLDIADGVLTITAAEDFSFKELTTVEAELLELPGYHNALGRLYDLTACETLNVTTTQLVGMVKLARSWGIDPSSKVALVAANQISAGILRIFASSFPSASLRVFLSVSEAERWLRRAGDRPVEINLDAPHYSIQLKGDITLDDVISQQRRRKEDPEYNDGLPILWDLREARLKESIQEVKQMAVYVAANHISDRAGSYTAILVGSHFMELMVREMMSVDDWPKDEIALFRSYREAISWLGEVAEPSDREAEKPQNAELATSS